METTNLSSFSVHCGVLGCNLISLVTVSCEGFVDAGRTKLAVLHPEFGTQQWAPARQAHWETPNSISVTLTLEQSKARSSLANTTFCCEFVTFPHGSRVACRDLHRSDPGVSGEQRETGRILTLAAHLTLFSVSRTLCPNSSLHSSSRPGGDLGNLRVFPVWFHLYTMSPVAAEALVRLGSVISTHRLVRCLLPLTLPLLSHRCLSKSQPSLTSTQAQMETQVRLEGWCLEQDTRGPQLDRDLGVLSDSPSFPTAHQDHPWPLGWIHHPNTFPNPQPPCSAALCEAVAHSDQHMPQCILLSTSDPHQSPCLSPQPPHLASTHSSFISIENGLYALA